MTDTTEFRRWAAILALFGDQDDDVADASDVDDIRFIINYDLPIL